MNASQGPITTMKSRCSPETVRGRHLFKITGYSLQKGLGTGESIRSATFPIGSHDWFIRYYPSSVAFKDNASIFLELMRKTTEVRALFNLRLLNWATGLSRSVSGDRVFNDVGPSWGAVKFMKKSELEMSYLHDDQLMMECDVTVIMPTLVPKSEKNFEIQVPPSGLLGNIGKLLESAEAADVTFTVQGDIFHAHKLVLVIRSPIFKAKLYGPVSDKSMKCVTIEDRDCSLCFQGFAPLHLQGFIACNGRS